MFWFFKKTVDKTNEIPKDNYKDSYLEPKHYRYLDINSVELFTDRFGDEVETFNHNFWFDIYSHLIKGSCEVHKRVISLSKREYSSIDKHLADFICNISKKIPWLKDTLKEDIELAFNNDTDEDCAYNTYENGVYNAEMLYFEINSVTFVYIEDTSLNWETYGYVVLDDYVVSADNDLYSLIDLYRKTLEDLKNKVADELDKSAQETIIRQIKWYRTSEFVEQFNILYKIWRY